MAAIFFDVDGTLVRWTGAYSDVLTTAFERTVGAPDEAWIAHYDERFFHHFDAFADDPYRRAFGDVCQRFDLDADPAAMAETLIDCEFDAVEPVPGAEILLPALAERHTLGLLTNGVPAVQTGKVDRFGLLEHFDVHVCSHDPEIEATKPDEGIFDVAKSRVDAETYVMIGDDRQPDIDGARRHDFETVHVDESATDLVAPDFQTLAALF